MILLEVGGADVTHVRARVGGALHLASGQHTSRRGVCLDGRRCHVQLAHCSSAPPPPHSVVNQAVTCAHASGGHPIGTTTTSPVYSAAPG